MPINLALHERQSDCFLSDATEILYGGAAGGGKSHAMRAIAIIYALQIPNLQIYLFRRLSDDLKKNHLDGESGFRNMLKDYILSGQIKINETTNQIIFPNGAKIHLSHCQYEKDVFKYQGVEINMLLIDELTHFSETIYKFLRSRVRLGGLIVPEQFKGKLPKIIASSNPGGVGHNFVKAAFIDNCKPFEIRKMPDEEGGMLRQFIPAKLKDNPTMTANDPLYEQKLMGLGGALAKAMLEGDWDAIDGAYFDKFNRAKHVIKPFKIPAHWYRVRAMDWGYSKPFAVYWGAVSEGLKLDDGRYIPNGAIVIYREYYGCVAGKENVGLRLENTELGKNIVEFEKDEHLNDMVADPSIFAHDGGVSINEQLTSVGCYSRPADNERLPGWQQIRFRLDGIDGKPMIYFFDTCFHLIRTLPVLQHDQTRPEDLDSDMEDHAADAVRYLCMSRPLTIKNPETDFRKDGKIYAVDLIKEMKSARTQKSYQ